LAALAPLDAIAWYGRALDVLDRSGDQRDDQRARLLVAKARAQCDGGEADFRGTLRDAAGLVIASGDVALLVKAALVRIPGGLESAADPDPGQVELLERALEAVGPADSPERARLLAALGDEYGSRDAERWGALAQEALETAERLGDGATILDVYRDAATPLRFPDRKEQRAAWDARMLALLADCRDLSTRALCLTHYSMSAIDVLDWDAFEGALAELRAIADATGLKVHRWQPLNLGAWAAMARGDLQEADQLSREALEAGLSAGLTSATASYGAHIMMQRLFAGRLDELVGHPSAEQSPVPSLALGWWIAFVWLTCEAGRTAEAAAMLRAHDVATAAVPFDMVWLQSIPLLGDTAAMLGMGPLASECYELLAPYGDRFFYSGAHDIGYIARYLGRMAAFLGRRSEAEGHLRYALTMHREKGLPYWEARSALDLAHLLAPSDRDELVRRATALAVEHGFGGPQFGPVGQLGD
jgi:hypothetical protein